VSNYCPRYACLRNAPIPQNEITRVKPACAAHHNQQSIPVQRNRDLW